VLTVIFALNCQIEVIFWTDCKNTRDIGFSINVSDVMAHTKFGPMVLR